MRANGYRKKKREERKSAPGFPDRRSQREVGEEELARDLEAEAQAGRRLAAAPRSAAHQPQRQGLVQTTQRAINKNLLVEAITPNQGDEMVQAVGGEDGDGEEVEVQPRASKGVDKGRTLDTKQRHLTETFFWE